MNVHTPSLIAGFGIAALVAITTGQQIIGSPTVEVRVVEVPTLTIEEPEVRTLPAPPLNGSVQYVVQPGELIDLRSIYVQWMGDSSQGGKEVNYLIRINASGETGYYGKTLHLPWGGRMYSYDQNLVRAHSGDVMTFRRPPANTSEADANFPATITFQVEK